jgi:hypothetical protein
MTFSAYMPSITEVLVGTKYILNGDNNKNYKLFADAYDDSVTNSACINDIRNLIAGKGLINEIEGGKSPSIHISNKDWGLIVLDYKKQGQTAIQIVWGKTTFKIYHIPIEQTALNVCKQTVKINGYWHCYDWKNRTKYTPKFYPKFDGKRKTDAIDMLIIQRPSNEPLFVRPDWFPALRWAQDEGMLAQHSYRDTKTGFSGQKIVNWVGGRGLTDEAKSAARQDLMDNFTGIDGQRVIVSINASPENSVVVDNIDPPNVNATYVNYTEEAERKILIAHSYPSILLAGSKTGFSSNADEIAVATKSTYRRVVNPAREVLLEPLQEIFNAIEEGKFKLAVEDFETESMDENDNGENGQPIERLGDKTAEQQNAEAQATLRGSVGGVQALLEIQASYVAGTTSYGSAIAMINLIYGFTEDEAKKLLGTPKEDATIITPTP